MSDCQAYFPTYSIDGIGEILICFLRPVDGIGSIDSPPLNWFTLLRRFSVEWLFKVRRVAESSEFAVSGNDFARVIANIEEEFLCFCDLLSICYRS